MKASKASNSRHRAATAMEAPRRLSKVPVTGWEQITRGIPCLQNTRELTYMELDAEPGMQITGDFRGWRELQTGWTPARLKCEVGCEGQ